MTVESVMNKDPVTVSSTDTFGHAFQLLVERRVRSLPVVDDGRIYRGMFDLYDIWKLLLPRAALLDGDSLRDLSFIPGSREQLRDKLREAAQRPITDFLDADQAPAIYPKTTVIEAILLLHRYGGNLPVIDPKTRQLAGLVSAWEILELLR
ncbi:MAG: CBS domain-containing protein [Gammaproteobacteria bacterium]|nr:CBS domain-containing protein [Gammaproteobacteria bacterium]